MQKISSMLRGTLIALSLCTSTVGALAKGTSSVIPSVKPADATTVSPRYQRGLEVLSTLNNGKPQPVFESMRKEFPFLAESTASYALGDVWGRQVLDARTRQLSATAAFAALGLRSFYKTHAGYALDAGVSPEELKEVIYLITVPAGFPRAIKASQALQELLVERGLAVTK